MVRNNFMMHLCTVATLCFFKLIFPRNYYNCDQDDKIPWVCVFKSMYLTLNVAIVTSNYIFLDVQKFPYLSKIYISAITCIITIIINIGSFAKIAGPDSPLNNPQLKNQSNEIA